MKPLPITLTRREKMPTTPTELPSLDSEEAPAWHALPEEEVLQKFKSKVH